MNISIKDIDDLKNHLEEAIKASFQKQMDPVIEKIAGVQGQVSMLEAAKTRLDEDVACLKKNQAKALVGWTVLVAGVSLFLVQIKTWFISHLHMS